MSTGTTGGGFITSGGCSSWLSALPFLTPNTLAQRLGFLVKASQRGRSRPPNTTTQLTGMGGAGATALLSVWLEKSDSCLAGLLLWLERAGICWGFFVHTLAFPRLPASSAPSLGHRGPKRKPRECTTVPFLGFRVSSAVCLLLPTSQSLPAFASDTVQGFELSLVGGTGKGTSI